MKPLHLCLVLSLAAVTPACTATVRGRATTGVVVRSAPPPPPRVVVGPAPYPGAVWVRGHYTWSGSRYVWSRGRWVRPRAGYVYVQPRYVRRGGGYVLVRGGWQRGSS